MSEITVEYSKSSDACGERIQGKSECQCECGVKIRMREPRSRYTLSLWYSTFSGLFYEPFLHDLDLIWRLDPHIDGFEQKGFIYV